MEHRIREAWNRTAPQLDGEVEADETSMGTYHQMSKKHLGRYVNEFVGRHNRRDLGTLAQMAEGTRNFRHKTSPYNELAKDPRVPCRNKKTIHCRKIQWK